MFEQSMIDTRIDSPVFELEWASPGSYSWLVPANVYEVKLCMIGAGHGGNTSSAARGGSSGQIYEGVYTVTPGETITVVVGQGSEWNNGGYSKFGTRQVNGGSSDNYFGNGSSRATCMGTFRDGYKSGDRYGGQAGFANGGSAPNGAGSRGSGGGGRESYNHQPGGNGVVHIKNV